MEFNWGSFEGGGGLEGSMGKPFEPLFPKPDSWSPEGDIVNLLEAGLFSS